MLACEGGGVKTKDPKRDRSTEMKITATSFIHSRYMLCRLFIVGLGGE